MAEKVAAGFILYRRAVKEIEYLMLQTSYGIQHWTPPKGEMEGINIYYSGKHSFFGKEMRSEEHTSELQSHSDLVCRLLLEKKNK